MFAVGNSNNRGVKIEIEAYKDSLNMVEAKTNSMKERVIQLLFEAIDEINQQLPAEDRLPHSETAIISGAGCSLDSLAFLGLIVSVEGRVNAALRTSVGTTAALANSDDPPPRTVGDLARLILSRLEENGDA